LFFYIKEPLVGGATTTPLPSYITSLLLRYLQNTTIKPEASQFRKLSNVSKAIQYSCKIKKKFENLTPDGAIAASNSKFREIVTLL
jgi:hypothetical protein